MQKVISTARLDKSIHYTIVTGPDISLAQLTEIPKNVEVQEFISDPFSYYKSADIVTSACGHGTTMETLSYGVPMLVFPDRGQKEQENNAQLIDEMDLEKEWITKCLLTHCLNLSKRFLSAKKLNKG